VEAPHLQDLYEAFSPQGLNVVAINIIPDQDSMVPDWVEKHGLTFPVLLGADPDQVVEDYELVSTPLSFLLDSSGKTLLRFDGYRPGLEDYFEQNIRKALASN
jgi:peroxiredoxin